MGYSYFFKELDRNFEAEKRIQYRDFLLNEFFNSTDNEKSEILEFYAQRYGLPAYNYMITNYWYSWQHGSRKISNIQQDRICSIVAGRLNNQAIHKLGVNDFIMGIKEAISEFLKIQSIRFNKTLHIKNIQEVIQIYENELQMINEIKIKGFQFNILTEADKIEALEIVKYILETKLRLNFENIQKDLEIFLPYMSKFSHGVNSALYSISDFNLTIRISDMGVIKIANLKLNNLKISSNSSYKEYSDKYLANKLFEIQQSLNNSECNSLLNKNDIQIFLDHYEELKKGTSEVTMNSTFQGAGGILRLKVQMKPFKLLKKLISSTMLKSLVYILTILTLLFLTFNFKYLSFFTSLASIFFISFFFQELRLLLTLNKELKAHGK